MLLDAHQLVPSAGGRLSREDCQGAYPVPMAMISQITPSLTTLRSHPWDITDSNLPLPGTFDKFQPWPHGHCHYIYNSQQEDGRRHVSGWAMRNTNNHNALILKKSCLGVLVCSRDCQPDNEEKVHIRPAICDKARRKQIGKPCPNSKCSGHLELLACRGHCGYPVTHFWRHAHGAIYFQAKGYHDHPRPELKSVAESKRGMAGTRHYKSFMVSDMFGSDRKRHLIGEPENVSGKKSLATLPGDDVLCSCPPFECTCIKSRPAYKSFRPAYDILKDSLPPPPPITQINITNAYPPSPGRPCLDLFLRGSTPSIPPRPTYSMLDSSRLFSPALSTGHGVVNIRGSSGSEASFLDTPSFRQKVSTFTDSAACVGTFGCDDGSDVRSTALSPPGGRLTTSPRFPSEQPGLGSGSPLLGDRLSGGPSSTFLSPSTEALFGGPSRMEELCSVPEVKEECQEKPSGFCSTGKLLESQSDSSSSSAMGPSLKTCGQLTSVVTSANDVLYSEQDDSSLSHLLSSNSPHAVLDAADAGISCSVLTSPSHSQVSTPIQSDKYFEELRPVQQKEFPGHQVPRTAYDVLHNPALFKEDPQHCGLLPTRPRDLASGATVFGQQDVFNDPHAMMPTRGDPPVMQYPSAGEMGSPWLGKCPGDYYQLPQSHQPYSSVYKQACNHSINITLTYN